MPVQLDTYSAWYLAQGLDETAGPDETKGYDEAEDASVFLDDIFGPHITGTHGVFTGPTGVNTGVGRVNPAAVVIEAGVGRLLVFPVFATVDVAGRTRGVSLLVWAGVPRTRLGPVSVDVGVTRPREADLHVMVGVSRTRQDPVVVIVASLLGDLDAILLLWDAEGTMAYGLPPSMAIDEQAIETIRPVFVPLGARSILPAGPRTARPRQLRISGVIVGPPDRHPAWEEWWGLDEAEGPDEEQGFDEDAAVDVFLRTLFGPAIDASADGLAQQLRSALIGRHVALERTSVPGRVLRLRGVRVSTEMHRGRFGGTARILVIDAEAADPFWYAITPRAVTFVASSSGQSFTVSNPGTVPAQPVAVVFRARAGTVVGPTVTNTRNGLVARFAGVLAAGQSVTLDARDRTAVFGDGSNALPWADPGWCERGFAFEPGENVLTYTDDAGSSHACDVYVIWTPAWW